MKKGVGCEAVRKKTAMGREGVACSEAGGVLEFNNVGARYMRH